MEYKLLVIKNPLGNIKVEDDIEKVISYFKRKTPLNIVVEYLDVDFKDLEHSLFLTKEGHDWYGLKDIKDIIRLLNIVPENKYHACAFVYDTTTTKAGNDGKYVTSWSTFGALVEGTEFVEIATNPVWDSVFDMYRVFTHELLHSFIRRCGRQGRYVQDAMDLTWVNGKLESYYKEFDIEATDGNRAVTIKNLEPYWDIVVKQKEVVKKYKYFSPKEIVGLKPELVEMLDKARGLAGIPFVINSGYRTKEHNSEIGGVENSSHLSGLAVDLRARNSVEHFKITKALMDVGFTRISRKYPNHIHVDCDKTKPQGVLF